VPKVVEMIGVADEIELVEVLSVTTGGLLAEVGGLKGVVEVSCTGLLEETVIGLSWIVELLILVGPCGVETGGTETVAAGLDGEFKVPDGGASMGEDVTLLKTIESGMSNPWGMFSSKLVVKNAIPAFPMPCIGPPLTFSQPLTGGAGR
jgi:hypothetical protein